MLPRRPFRISRRRFMAAALAAAPAALSAGCLPPGKRDEPTPPARPDPNPSPPAVPAPSEWAAFAAKLAVFRDLRRHFIFEYYPWYHADPWRHWDEAGRTPPIDIGAFAVPALGPYDSRDAKVIEQHARWIAEAGVGAVNISWWGPGSVEDRAVPLVMDVMRPAFPRRISPSRSTSTPDSTATPTGRPSGTATRRRFEPPIEATGWDTAAREEALNASRNRILDALRTNLRLQLDPALTDAKRGFFLTYINSFNEWHEGTAFEPAANLADLTPAQRAIGYHNPDEGRWRLELLQNLLRQLTTP